MSYPFSLDLHFGSEKATVDPIGRISFGKGGRSSLPTTVEDFLALMEERRVFSVNLNNDHEWNGYIPLLKILVGDTLQDMVLGFVSLDDPSDTTTVTPIENVGYENRDGVGYWIFNSDATNVFVVLKAALN